MGYSEYYQDNEVNGCFMYQKLVIRTGKKGEERERETGKERGNREGEGQERERERERERNGERKRERGEIKKRQKRRYGTELSQCTYKSPHLCCSHRGGSLFQLPCLGKFSMAGQLMRVDLHTK